MIHRDIKLGNILMNKDKSIKLCDFGFSKSLNNDDAFANSFFGICNYFPPETLDDKGFGKKSDIWQLGVVLYQMLMLHAPFRDNNIVKLTEKIMKRPHKKVFKSKQSG